MIKLKYINLLKSSGEFFNFNILPFISLFWNDDMVCINIGLGRHCFQISFINFIYIMNKPDTTHPKQQSRLEKISGKIMVLAFGIPWLMIVFKALNIGFMQNLAWYTIIFPLLFFVLACVIYGVCVFIYVRIWKAPFYGLTDDQIRLRQRRWHLSKKPTKIKDGLAKSIMAIIAIIIAYLILA